MRLDLEAEYDNRRRVPEHPAIIEAWGRDATAFRDGARAELDLSYGPRERTRLDLFLPEGDAGAAPLAVFFHGGYWRAFDRTLFSHVARGLLGHGVAVAIPSYDLCPTVRLAEIVAEAREAIAFLYRRLQKRPFVFGHSAGGHLAACMLATDWPGFSADLPKDLVPAALGISGLYDLEPLVETSVNVELRLSAAEARALSPLLWPAPAGTVFDAYVGSRESAEYLRQSRAVAEAWAKEGVRTAYREIVGANHFTALAPFADPASHEVARMMELVWARG
jgi:arylformamidase